MVADPEVRSSVTGTIGSAEPAGPSLTPSIAGALLEVFERAHDPGDAIELERLYLGRAEYGVVTTLGLDSRRTGLLEAWQSSRRYREVDPDSLLFDPVLPILVKRLFNAYFREDLYGSMRSPNHVILSSGSADETRYGLPAALKDAVRIALDRDWYGYSDSLGRESARSAIAEMENVRVPGARYDERNIAVTLGGTAAVSGLLDYLSLQEPAMMSARALCAIPNYPPLVAAMARRFRTELVPVSCYDGQTDIRGLIDRLSDDVRVVLLQSVTNPTGTPVPEDQITELIECASPDTVIILDECHECLGQDADRSLQRADPRVARVASLSKSFSAPGLKVGWITASAALLQDYYEYASTTYGGPASVHYLLIEVMARFERWRREGLVDISPSALAEWTPPFHPSEAWLRSAFTDYLAHCDQREDALIGRRDASAVALACAGLRPIRPTHSLNIAFSPVNTDDYVTFRRLLGDQLVSLLPGVLTFCLDGAWLRMTTARTDGDLAEGLKRLLGHRW